MSGTSEATGDLVRLALYRPIQELFAGKSGEELKGLKPNWFRQFAVEAVDGANAERRLAAQLPSFGAITDHVSELVAEQYEGNPYPRWTTLERAQPLSSLRRLASLVQPAPLSFAAGRFNVLIAGAGTGRQAIQAAQGYGPNADVLAIDLSRASLAYGARMAKRHTVKNLEFAQADILSFEPGRTFSVIEAVGVLHHMGEPMDGWRRLVDMLEPGGFILIGLYSAISRRAVLDLQLDEDYPGAGCGDDAARAYRQRLMARNPDVAGGKLIRFTGFFRP